jgi:tRNA G10  N-methylase Trm11
MKFLVKDAVDLSKFIKTETVSAFITEPFLGPQRGKLDLDVIVKELEELYSEAIREFYKVLKPGGTVVMVWPLFFGKYALNPDIYEFKMQSLIPEDFKKINFINNELTERGNIIYGRAGQKVFREIIVLKK